LRTGWNPAARIVRSIAPPISPTCTPLRTVAIAAARALLAASTSGVQRRSSERSTVAAVSAT
jgi:hypothetical protein